MTAPRWLVPLALIALLAGLLGWRLSLEERTTEAPIEPQGPLLSAYARDFVLTTTNAQGSEAYQLRAPIARYYEKQDLWQFEAPRWRIQSDQGPAWHGRSDFGRSWADNTQARLSGNVEIERREAEGPTRLRTERLDLLPPKRYAETDQPVTLTTPRAKVSAIGAQAWLAEDRVELLDNVRGLYESSP